MGLALNAPRLTLMAPFHGRSMRQFALFIDNEVKGPHSEYEIQDMISAGTVGPDTLCAPVGSEEWQPLSAHFAFGSGLKLSRRNAETAPAEDTEPALPRLDPDIRRRLLVYGLADAATVDQISPAQADTLIAQTESRIRRALATWRIAAVASVAAGAAAGWLALGNPAARSALGNVADTAAVDEPAALKRWNRLQDEARRYAKNSAEALAAPFAEPEGGANATATLLGRLVVDEEKAHNVSGRVAVSAEALVAPLATHGISLGDSIAVLRFASDIPEAQLRIAARQAETLALVLSPLMDQTGFAKELEAVLAGFPDNADIPEAARLRGELGAIRIADLPMAIDKVRFRADTAEKVGKGSGPKLGQGSPAAYGEWAESLRKFANDLTALRDRIRINVNPAARGEVWSEFNRGPGAELAAWAIANARETLATDKDGAFRMEFAPAIKADSAAKRLLIRLRIQEDAVFLPWDSAFAKVEDLVSERIPNATFLEREAYRVVGKAEVGGKRLVHRGEVGGRMLTVSRESPRWHYLSVGRDRDTEPLLFRVSAERFAKAEVGQPVPVAELSQLPLHAKLAESAPCAGMSAE